LNLHDEFIKGKVIPMRKEKSGIIRLHPNDNVVVVMGHLAPSSTVEAGHIVIQQSIPPGHKVATEMIPQGAFIRKYGHPIGIASRDIQSGEHVHTHNVDMWEAAHDSAFPSDAESLDAVFHSDQAMFQGIVRDDGRVATRNYIGVLPSVACSATVCRSIAEIFTSDMLGAYPNVDGVVGLTQTGGCGTSPNGEGFEILQRCLAGYAGHPNFWGVLLVGLGCEVNQLDGLLDNAGLEKNPSLHVMNIQESGGTKRTIQRAVEIIKAMLPQANQSRRQPVSAANLVLGTECGGSDAYSGITANPALGFAADRIVRNGGTVILSETTEIYGAEHLLTQRAATPTIARKLMDLIHWWEDYTKKNGASINNNPSPGNKAGGLTTILEKSLGAVSKGGSTPLMEVYRYGEAVRKKGFVFMDTPGYDPVSLTGMIAGGTNLVCFTTGCGSVLGCKPVPVIKLASNTEMFQSLSEDMDINCGTIADGEATVAELGDLVFKQILETASGQRTRSELLGFGDNEFMPWPIGAVL
jgi:altronate hydrolase